MGSASLSWAVVGTGTISRSVVADFAQLDDARIATVHSRSARNAELFASEFDIPRATSDFGEILEDPTIDAIYLATPFVTHFALTRAALRAGKHVLVEKPIAMNAGEVAELFDTAASNHVFLMEGMWMKFNPAFRRLHEEIQDGTIGEPRSMRAAFSFPFPNDGGSRWDVNRSGSTLLDQGIYPVTLAHSVFGSPIAVHATGVVRADGVDLAQHFTLDFEENCFAQCVSGMTEFADSSASVSGTTGWISLPVPFWATTEIDIHAGTDMRDVFRPPRLSYPQEGNGYVPMLREVTAAILAGATELPVHARQDTVEVFTILDEIRLKMNDGAGLREPIPASL